MKMPVCGFALMMAACGSEPAKAPKPAPGVTPPPGAMTGEPGQAGPKAPAPPPEMSGQGRLINLYRDAAGAPVTVDVWAQRSFKHEEQLLAKAIQYGAASDWFAMPKGMSVVAVVSGASPDGETLGGIFSGKPDEAITGILARGANGAEIGSYWEAPATGPNVEAGPPPGQGTIILRAGTLRVDEPTLAPTFGGTSFHVGDGKGACYPQPRLEAKGFAPNILGGTQPVVLDLPPGAHQVTLHHWTKPEKCAGPSLDGFTVEVVAGTRTLVNLYSPDGKTLTTLAVPMRAL